MIRWFLSGELEIIPTQLRAASNNSPPAGLRLVYGVHRPTRTPCKRHEAQQVPPNFEATVVQTSRDCGNRTSPSLVC